MDARKRIWYELKQAKSNVICLQRYTDSGRRRLRYFNLSVMAFVTVCVFGGIIGYSDTFGDSWRYAVLGGQIAVGAICIILSNGMQSEQELSTLDRLLDFYAGYMNRVESLWYDYDKQKITDDEMTQRLFALKEDEADKYSALNNGIRALSKKERSMIDKDCQEYLTEIF